MTTQSTPIISWIIPFYNDQDHVEVILRRSLDLLNFWDLPFEIITVNDGSSDQTLETLQKFSDTTHPLKIIHHRKNQGYGEALRSGFQQAQATQWIGYTDGDAQYDPMEWMDEISAEEIQNPTQAIAYLGVKKNRAEGLYRMLQSRCYHKLVHTLFGKSFQDINASLKLFPASLLRSQFPESRSAFIDAEILLKMNKAGVSFRPIPVHHYARYELGTKLRSPNPTRNASFSGNGHRPKVIAQTLVDLFRYFCFS